MKQKMLNKYQKQIDDLYLKLGDKNKDKKRKDITPDHDFSTILVVF